jgi:hypothetical protein
LLLRQDNKLLRLNIANLQVKKQAPPLPDWHECIRFSGWRIFQCRLPRDVNLPAIPDIAIQPAPVLVGAPQQKPVKDNDHLDAQLLSIFSGT